MQFQADERQLYVDANAKQAKVDQWVAERSDLYHSSTNRNNILMERKKEADQMKDIELLQMLLQDKDSSSKMFQMKACFFSQLNACGGVSETSFQKLKNLKNNVTQAPSEYTDAFEKLRDAAVKSKITTVISCAEDDFDYKVSNLSRDFKKYEESFDTEL